MISEYICKYERNGHYIYLINNGNAINFLHGAVVGDFILLVQKEMIDNLIYMRDTNLEHKVQEGLDSIRERIADLWLKYFLLINI